MGVATLLVTCIIKLPMSLKIVTAECIIRPCRRKKSGLYELMIGDKVPETDSRWLNFLRLLEIIDVLFAPVLSNNLVAYLHLLIEEHHQLFTKLYPSCNITPKIHYMVHYPHWITRYILTVYWVCNSSYNVIVIHTHKLCMHM